MREIAEKVFELAKKYPKYKSQIEKIKIVNTQSGTYYGSGYQDMQMRIPLIKRAQEILGWQPKTDVETALKRTMDFYLQ